MRISADWDILDKHRPRLLYRIQDQGSVLAYHVSDFFLQDLSGFVPGSGATSSGFSRNGCSRASATGSSSDGAINKTIESLLTIEHSVYISETNILCRSICNLWRKWQ